HGFKLFGYLYRLFTGCFLAFLRMDGFQHEGYSLHFLPGCYGKDVPVKMYCTALVSGIRKDFRNGLKHTEIFITDNQAHTGKPSFFQPYKERAPAFAIFFHSFSSSEDFTAAILADADSNQNGNILNLTAPAAFQVDTIYINIGIFPGKRTCTPGFDMFIRFFI